MTYRTIHPQFDDTFATYARIPEGIKEALWNYLAYGLHPGGFVEAVLENNFIAAACRADAFWDGEGFKYLAKWIIHRMPIVSYGTKEKIAAWMALSDEERCEIMIEMKLRPGIFDILRGAPA
jgi:hypothetical protein